jgi:hypothetical protein
MREIAVETGDNKRSAQALVMPTRSSPRHADRSRDDMADTSLSDRPAPEVYEVRYPFVRDVYQAVVPEPDDPFRSHRH